MIKETRHQKCSTPDGHCIDAIVEDMLQSNVESVSLCSSRQPFCHAMFYADVLKAVAVHGISLCKSMQRISQPCRGLPGIQSGGVHELLSNKQE